MIYIAPISRIESVISEAASYCRFNQSINQFISSHTTDIHNLQFKCQKRSSSIMYHTRSVFWIIRTVRMLTYSVLA